MSMGEGERCQSNVLNLRTIGLKLALMVCWSRELLVDSLAGILTKYRLRWESLLLLALQKISNVVGQKENTQLLEAFAPTSHKTCPLVGFV